ncbi:site-specific integrase [Akkermansiaceae bacterium]|nr:site-specific integrase [Akkermansiaceae bacterium]
MAKFKRTGITYLVRRDDNDLYYWQAKINDVPRRGSLKTVKSSVAKARLPFYLARARARFEGCESIRLDLPGTAGEWVDEWVQQQQQRARLKGRTKRDALGYGVALKKADWSGVLIKDLKEQTLLNWWRGECVRLQPRTLNSRLRVLKASFLLAVESGLIMRSPAEKLERVPVGKKLVVVPTYEELVSIVDSVRAQGKRASLEVADMIEFCAYSGLRPGELSALRCEDVGADALAVRGGEEGTKNRKEREVPIVPQLVPVIERLKCRERVGSVFSIGSPYRALVSACERLGFSHYDVYRLRHYFATVCLESGVDVPTVALWMGHSDGGKLLLEVYQHVRRSHSQEQAMKVRFA